MLLEQNDAVLLLRSDNPAHIHDAHERLLLCDLRQEVEHREPAELADHAGRLGRHDAVQRGG